MRAADTLAPDAQIEQRLFSFINNPINAKFNKISVAQLEKIVNGVCKMKPRGGSFFVYNNNSYEEFIYSLDINTGDSGYYSIVLLTQVDESNFDKDESHYYERPVLGARLIYTSKGGVSYYNNLIPPLWLQTGQMTIDYSQGSPKYEQPKTSKPEQQKETK